MNSYPYNVGVISDEVKAKKANTIFVYQSVYLFVCGERHAARCNILLFCEEIDE